MLGLVKLPAHLAYPALAALVGVESVGLPVPGEAALITAGILAKHGHLRIELVIIIAAVAGMIGDNIGYAIGRTGGRRLLEHPGLLERHRRRVLQEGEPFFARHGPKAVFLGRWIAGLRIAAAWLAGINRMPWPSFLLFNALGAIAWAASVGLTAYQLGPAAEHLIKRAGLAGIALALVAAGGFLLLRGTRAKRAC